MEGVMGETSPTIKVGEEVDMVVEEEEAEVVEGTIWADGRTVPPTPCLPLAMRAPVGTEEWEVMETPVSPQPSFRLRCS